MVYPFADPTPAPPTDRRGTGNRLRRPSSPMPRHVRLRLHGPPYHHVPLRVPSANRLPTVSETVPWQESPSLSCISVDGAPEGSPFVARACCRHRCPRARPPSILSTAVVDWVRTPVRVALLVLCRRTPGCAPGTAPLGGGYGVAARCLARRTPWSVAFDARTRPISKTSGGNEPQQRSSRR